MDLNPVKQKLLLMRCAEHGSHPEVAIRGDKLEIKCCCDKFKATLVGKSKDLIAESAKNDIAKAIKNIFK
jgi:hypothetical protein